MSIAQTRSPLMQVTAKPPEVFVRGVGSYLFDESGKAYLDWIQGWAVNALGHSPAVLVDALQQGRADAHHAGAPRLKLSHAMRDALVADASGDRLDAVLCLVQAGWAAGQPRDGMPADVDPGEGWIVGAR